MLTHLAGELLNMLLQSIWANKHPAASGSRLALLV
jgi:hypothetical protein